MDSTKFMIWRVFVETNQLVGPSCMLSFSSRVSKGLEEVVKEETGEERQRRLCWDRLLYHHLLRERQEQRQGMHSRLWSALCSYNWTLYLRTYHGCWDRPPLPLPKHVDLETWNPCSGKPWYNPWTIYLAGWMHPDDALELDSASRIPQRSSSSQDCFPECNRSAHSKKGNMRSTSKIIQYAHLTLQEELVRWYVELETYEKTDGPTGQLYMLYIQAS